MQIELSDVERLAADLDGVELDEKDRATLHAIFGLAGEATGANEGEVRGFDWNGSSGDDLPAIGGGGLFGTFCASGKHLLG